MILICMRLADMKLVHPEQITGTCSNCGHTVGIYPSGQKAIKEVPGIEIVCHICKPDNGVQALAPGAFLEPFQSVRKQ